MKEEIPETLHSYTKMLLDNFNKVKDNTNYFYTLVSLLFIAIVLRLYFAYNIPLWYDEALQANAIISFLENGIPNFPSGGEYWRALPYTVSSSISAAVLGTTDVGLRFASIIYGLATIVLTKHVAEEFFESKTAIIASAFLTFSAWQIAFSTQVRMYSMLQFIFLLGVFLIYKIGRDFKKEYLILFGLIVLIGIKIHLTAAILPFIALMYLAIVRRDLIFEYRSGLLIALILGLSTVFWYNDYFAILDTLTYKPDNFGVYFSLLTGKVPVMFYLGSLGFLISLKKDLKTGLLVFLAVFPGFYIYSFHIDKIAERYLHFIIPFLAIYTGLVINQFAAKFSELSEKIKPDYILILIVPVLIFAGSGFNYSFEEGNYRPYFANDRAYNYVENHSLENDVLVSQWGPPSNYYFRPPDYSLFGGEIDYREYSEDGVNFYTGAKFINSSEKLAEVVEENDRGWIVLRKMSLDLKDKEIREIVNSMETRRKYERMAVWHWNKSFTP